MDGTLKKIVVFFPNWLGDALFVTPLFKAIKQTYPGCFLGCILAPRVKPLLLNNPFVDELIEFDERSIHASAPAKIRFISQLRRKKYDTALLLHRSLTRTCICFLAGISRRAGYAYAKRTLLLTARKLPVDKNAVHKQDYYLGLAELIGVPVHDKSCRIFILEDERRRAQDIIASCGSTDTVRIAISPFTNWAPKDWPLQNYETLIRLIAERIPEAAFFVTAQSNTSGLREMIRRMENYKIINLAGKTSLRELAALYEKMSVVVAGDSGPLHIAAAVETAYLGLYGATSPELTAPRTGTQGTVLYKNDTCPTPCYEPSCAKDNACMKAIAPADAAGALLKLLNHS